MSPNAALFIDFCTKPCSTHCLWTAFRLAGRRAPLLLSPPISWPLGHFLSFHHQSANSIHIHPSDNSIWTPSHSIHVFFLFWTNLQNSDMCPSITSFIPITIHLLTFVPLLAHPPICLPTLATLNSVHLPQFFFWTL